MIFENCFSFMQIFHFRFMQIFRFSYIQISFDRTRMIESRTSSKTFTVGLSLWIILN